ncbi:hypothetical protein MTBBW1_3360002 [Desulfamplus magnetovallimortis]|uniref:Uncharacterized protein n=1 Tax=Desulfamplus magnetovallimortis TaxID=1246637 RepID=A0A1W1HG79_9BACT|nr:hypothetical protein MTBBW1_3360002 [Desulfamplus magnetovallimortis]
MSKDQLEAIKQYMSQSPLIGAVFLTNLDYRNLEINEAESQSPLIGAVFLTRKI